MVIKKITSEELAKLKEIQDTYYKTLVDIGKFEYEKRLILDRVRHLESEIELCFSDLGTLQEQEQELKEKLQKKYGVVSIDTITGEISEPSK